MVLVFIWSRMLGWKWMSAPGRIVTFIEFLEFIEFIEFLGFLEFLELAALILWLSSSTWERMRGFVGVYIPGFM